MRITLIVDPALEPQVGTPLLEPQGEYLHAVRQMAESPVAARLPAGVVIELYAYEILERLRGLLAEGHSDVTRTIPLCPVALIAATGIEAHAVAELTHMYPIDAPAKFVTGARDPDQVKQAIARVLIRPCVSEQAYLAQVAVP